MQYLLGRRAFASVAFSQEAFQQRINKAVRDFEMVFGNLDGHLKNTYRLEPVVGEVVQLSKLMIYLKSFEARDQIGDLSGQWARSMKYARSKVVFTPLENESVKNIDCLFENLREIARNNAIFLLF
jgi:hypothetical protein